MEVFLAKAKQRIPLEKVVVKKGEKITVMKQEKLVYLWNHTGIYKIDDRYVGRIIKYYKRN